MARSSDAFAEMPIDDEPAHRDNAKQARSGQRLIRSSAEFVANFVPPEYVVDGILQRRFVYSLTGQTGAGKTAIMLLLSALVALERMLGERGVEPGRVLYFAGENPDDARMRWIAMAQQMDFDTETIDVHFIPGTFKISEMFEIIRGEIADHIGDLALIVIDTSAAFFEGENENDNREQGQHARRFRMLTTMPGGPCVLVACHPPKNAGDDNLQPRGGGSFIAEMDGNLTARQSHGLVELHTQGKFRGPDFAPVTFQLRTVTHERLKTSKGRLIPIVVASHISEAAQEEIEKAVRSHEDQLLAVLAKSENRSTSHRDLAKLLGWFMRDGAPYQVRVRRALETLKKAKLIKIERDGIELTPAGRKAANSGNGETNGHSEPADFAEAHAHGVDFDEARALGLRPNLSASPWQVMSPEPPGTACAHCGQTDGNVYLIRRPARGVAGDPLHESCAAAFFKRGDP